ncbi:hypothetical protein BKH46_07705 [Helicobacter sp. 12S02634-8]|uniref:DUF4376 domain-containing protein n=1 Tax=Helicobacter sp. 12S02634-8 TaxID=1476199 RepID=UPI000BA531FB|nr:hypothetical protein [Helicobacter sp. 12S02634-8]PAF46346.1 hypothetical protein BKH46_07705 [Helicobacter sp. 12S02634-8]
MKIYLLENEKITEVVGTYKVLTQDTLFTYVESETELSEPFKEGALPQEFLQTQADALNAAKAQKTQELNAACDASIQSFISDALGSMHIYDAKLEDQLNLLGLVGANIDSFFRCAPLTNPLDKQNLPHTKAQLKAVYNDALKTKSEAIFKCGVLKEKVKKASSKEEVLKIVWEEIDGTQP